MLALTAFAALVSGAEESQPVDVQSSKKIENRIDLITSDAFAAEQNAKAEGHWTFKTPSKEFLEKRLRSMGGLTAPAPHLIENEHTTSMKDTWLSLPASWDQRQHGCVGAVRDQGGCGGCWAFGAAETFTDNYCHYDGYIVDLSAEDLIACDTTCGGCQGGGLVQTWEWIQAHGITTQSCLPFTSGNGNAGYCPNSCQGGAQLSRYRCGRYNHYVGVENMKSAIYQYGAAEVQFSVYNNFFGYSGGVYTGNAGSAYAGDHAVKAIGWGSEGGVQYWIIQNSWNASWGEGGYAKIQMGVVNIGAYGMFNCPMSKGEMTAKTD